MRLLKVRLAAAAVVAAWASVPGAARSAGRPVAACVLRQAEVEGIDQPALDRALLLEAREAGLDLALAPPSAGDCPEPRSVRDVVLVIGPPATVTVNRASGDVRRLHLENTDRIDRAREVAKLVVTLLTGDFAHAPIVDDRLPARARPPAPPPASGPGVQGYAHVAGQYLFQAGPSLHALAVGVEAGVSLLDERIQAGLAAALQPRQDLGQSSIPASIQSVPVLLSVRGGWAFSRVLVRVGVHAGFEWRQVRYQPPARLTDRTETSEAAILGGEFEVVVRVTPALRVAVAAVGRGYFGGPSLSWDGRGVYDSPRGSFGVEVRIGAVFPARGNQSPM